MLSIKQFWPTSKKNNDTASVTAHTPTKKTHHHPKQNQVNEGLNTKEDDLPASPVNNMAEQTQSHTPEKPVDLFSYEYNFKGRYYVKEVTGMFYELKNEDALSHPSVIYVPKGKKELDDYKHGGSKQKKTRKNRRKSNRRR